MYLLLLLHRLYSSCCLLGCCHCSLCHFTHLLSMTLQLLLHKLWIHICQIKRKALSFTLPDP